MTVTTQPAVIDFNRYPSVGTEDWRYAFASARIRVLESLMIPRNTLVDMANADSFHAAADLLGGSEYALSGEADNASIEAMLLDRRRDVRSLWMQLMEDEPLIQVFRAQEDFANMRLAIRRVVTERPLGLDYSDDGAVPAEEFEEIFEQENYERLPEYLQEAVEAAVLGYYENKDIRRIDYEIDRVEAAWRVRRACQLRKPFCIGLSRIQIDLNNLRTMFRLKMAERDDRQFFLPDGYVETDRLVQGLDQGYDSLSALFFSTPYYEIVEEGVRYIKEQESFLKLERGCEDYLMGYLRTTRSITAGYQPLIAYRLMKEAEIRTLRMILVGKKNGLAGQLILDRLGTWIA